MNCDKCGRESKNFIEWKCIDCALDEMKSLRAQLAARDRECEALRAALNTIANGAELTIGQLRPKCNWCGMTGNPVDHWDDCPVTIARAALAPPPKSEEQICKCGHRIDQHAGWRMLPVETLNTCSIPQCECRAADPA